jgi:hypothetical protein
MARLWRSVADAAHPGRPVAGADARDRGRRGVRGCCALSAAQPAAEERQASQAPEPFADGPPPLSRWLKPQSERGQVPRPLEAPRL